MGWVPLPGLPWITPPCLLHLAHLLTFKAPAPKLIISDEFNKFRTEIMAFHFAYFLLQLLEGGSVNKENPQKMFPVVVVVWISITVLPVEIINPKNDYCHVKTNYQKILKLNFCSVHGATLGRGKFGLGSTPCVHSRNHSIWPKKVFWTWCEKMLISRNMRGDISLFYLMFKNIK